MLTWRDNAKRFPNFSWLRRAAYFETVLRKCLVELNADIGLAEHQVERVASILAGRLIEEGVE